MQSGTGKIMDKMRGGAIYCGFRSKPPSGSRFGSFEQCLQRGRVNFYGRIPLTPEQLDQTIAAEHMSTLPELPLSYEVAQEPSQRSARLEAIRMSSLPSETDYGRPQGYRRQIRGYARYLALKKAENEKREKYGLPPTRVYQLYDKGYQQSFRKTKLFSTASHSDLVRAANVRKARKHVPLPKFERLIRSEAQYNRLVDHENAIRRKYGAPERRKLTAFMNGYEESYRQTAIFNKMSPSARKIFLYNEYPDIRPDPLTGQGGGARMRHNVDWHYPTKNVYFKVGRLPKGFRRASVLSAFQHRKLGRYGQIPVSEIPEVQEAFRLQHGYNGLSKYFS